MKLVGLEEEKDGLIMEKSELKMGEVLVKMVFAFRKNGSNNKLNIIRMAVQLLCFELVLISELCGF